MAILASRKKRALFKGLITVLGCSCLLLGCGNEDKATENSPKTNIVSSSPTTQELVIRVGYENTTGEPFDLGMKRWQEEVAKLSNGSMRLELYPGDGLGTKNDLLKRVQSGENIICKTDGADLYQLGAYDFGVLSGPFLFKNWDEAYHLTNSKWFAQENVKLAQNHGMHIISFKWNNSIRYLLSREPIKKFSDIQGLRVRVPNNDIQVNTWTIMKAKAVTIPNSQLYRALANKEIDAVDLPLTRIAGANLYQEAPYLLMTSHSYSIAGLVISEKFWNNLNPEQQRILTESCERSAKFYNVLHDANDYTVLNQMKKDGLQVIVPDPNFFKRLNQKANSFYILPVFKKWTPGLYYKVLGAKAIPWSYYTNGGKLPEKKTDNQSALPIKYNLAQGPFQGLYY